MKKSIKMLIIISSSVVALALILFAGFFWLANSMETYQTGVLNSAPEYRADQFEDIWELSRYEDSERVPEPTKEITFMGKTYTGTYEQTVRTDCLSDTWKDVYSASNGYVQFHIGVDSGRLLSVTFGNTQAWYSREYILVEVEEPEQYALNRAREIASEFVSLDSYQQVTVDTQTLTDNGREITFYYIRFTKVISGIETTDYVGVNITSKGSLTAVHFGEMGAFDNYDVSFLTKTALDANLNTVARNAVKKLDTDITDPEYLGHYAEFQKLCLTPSGEFAVFTRLRITTKIHSAEKDMEPMTGALDVTTILPK